MLRKKIMAVLSEGGSECIGNPIQIQKYVNGDNSPKNGSMEFIFGPDLDIDEKPFSEKLTEICRHYDDVMTSSLIQVIFG